MDRFTPLNHHFPEWYASLTPNQQELVRKVLISIHSREVNTILSKQLFQTTPELLNAQQATQMQSVFEAFCEEGDLQDAVGHQILILVQADAEIVQWSDCLTQLAEMIEPSDGSTSEFAMQEGATTKEEVQSWIKSTFKDLGDDLLEAFPKEATPIALEWQRKRTLRKAAALEVDINAGARIDLSRERLN